MRKALFILGILNDEDLEWIIANGQRENIASRTTLIEEGKPIEALYIVLAGAFAVLAGGKEVGRSLSGEVLGEVSFIDSRPPSATVRAHEDSSVLTIPRSLLSRKLEQDNAFAARFYRSLAVFLADRLRGTTSRLGYGQGGPLSANTEYEDELDPAVLDNVSLAGARFDMILRRLQGA